MAPDAGPSWSPLIVRLRADDEGAFRELVESQYDRVAALAYHYVRTHDAARDIAQDVFVDLWKRRRELREDTRLIAYIMQATRYASFALLRRDASAARMERALLREYEIVHPHDENSGLDSIAAEELNAKTRAVFATLSPRVREITLLYHERGLSPAEIAEMLGIAPTTVYGKLRQGMQALARALRDSSGDPNRPRR